MEVANTLLVGLTVYAEDATILHYNKKCDTQHNTKHSVTKKYKNTHHNNTQYSVLIA
jgi:hypothetical protein